MIERDELRFMAQTQIMSALDQFVIKNLHYNQFKH